MDKEKKSLTKWFYWFLFAVAVITVYKTLDNFNNILDWIGNLFGVLMPFVMGILIAYLLYIPCRKVESLYLKRKSKFVKRKARGLSIITVYIMAVLLIMIVINFILPVISESIIDLVKNLPEYYTRAIEMVEELPEDSIINKVNVKEIISNLQKIDLEQFLAFEKLTQYAKGVINFANSIFEFFVAIIVSVYVLLERRKIVEFFGNLCRAVFKEETSNNIGRYFNTADNVFFKFLSGQLLDAVVMGILASVAMSILGVKYAVLLGFMIGLFNLIPYFGAIIAIIIAALITIFTGGIGKAIAMIIIVTILQQIDANIINPKILGSSLKISPLLVIFAVTIGGEYFGVLGMFLAVPVFTVIKIILCDYIEHKNKISH